MLVILKNFSYSRKFASTTARQRWAESEKLTPNPDPKTKTSDLAPDLVSFQILDSGSGPCPFLSCYLFIQYIGYQGINKVI